MATPDIYTKMRDSDRRIEQASTDDAELGPLSQLPGTWSNTPGLPGHGWNMIALPFGGPAAAPFNYRLLVNQYNEDLKFTLIDSRVPNRGIRAVPGGVEEADQFVVTLDYVQSIKQIKADDFPESGLAGEFNQDIHHEPGLWLNMTNEVTDGVNIGRLASVPHGDSLLALGSSEVLNGPPVIPDYSGLPIGGPTDLSNPYLGPYKHFHDNLFEGVFDPVNPNDLLKVANQDVNIVRTTKLEVDTTVYSGGIHNIPFVVKQANAAQMKSIFWIQELDEADDYGKPKLRLQYFQTVILDFFGRRDGGPGLVRWPHVSINTLEKVS
jgi:hypothetical protein